MVRLLLTLHSGISTGRTQGTIWVTGDRTQVSLMQGMHPTLYYRPALNFFCLKELPVFGRDITASISIPAVNIKCGKLAYFL